MYAIKSKVLIHDVNQWHLDALRGFCESHDLVGLVAEDTDCIRDVLDLNIDLGAIFLCDEPDKHGRTGQQVATDIHNERAELPVFLRRAEGEAAPEDTGAGRSFAWAGSYAAGETERLEELIRRYIFSRYYPTKVIKDIIEQTTGVIRSTLARVDVQCASPFLISDKIVDGEVMSLMRIESEWCRGYMMLESEEACIASLINGDRLNAPGNLGELSDYQRIHSTMSELTNSVWGKLKVCFLTYATKNLTYRSEVPCVINYKRNFLTFGSDEPTLCFRYEISDWDKQLDPVYIHQKFAFHLKWAPEKRQQDPEKLQGLINSGKVTFL